MHRKLYIETYGCQMNVADSEVVVSILQDDGFSLTGSLEEADLILVNTCSVRDNAEQRVWGRLDVFKQHKKKNPGMLIGVIGCMAERLKEQLLETDKMVELVVGPDAYRDLPRLIGEAYSGHEAVNVLLSREETYADISPVRLDKNGVSAFVSIMRGCNNMCSYCVVPYVRGIERSRDPATILGEVRALFNRGYREVTLLGQNVDSYSYEGKEGNTTFADLLELTAKVNSLLRVRFSTSHPKDMSDEVLKVMSHFDNICKHIHLPAQSGSSRILELMNRKYDREWYMNRIRAIRKILPGCAVSTDMMTGFCTETEEDHRESLSLMRWAEYDFAYMFKYNERPNTKAARKYPDDIPEKVKTRRLNEIIELQNKLSLESKKKDVGKIFEVLVEGFSRKSTAYLSGRTSQNKVVVFPAGKHAPGDYVNVEITDCTSATLIGKTVTSSH
ncbi:MAG: tRNA (N6-isopentenyl adenosine(37)-C2)-methylthiotransferase MiaB [Bacteroidales bacterium]|nr:tRNA (N6-isopentenyl adenosine(37)-C2)-methylthiotransferase MiaB [Bacteroidales bacterium]